MTVEVETVFLPEARLGREDRDGARLCPVASTHQEGLAHCRHRGYLLDSQVHSLTRCLLSTYCVP